jgi:hypothetical protein
MDESWIKIYRKFLDWEWYDDVPTKVLFLHLLLKASNADKEWRGMIVKRGQVVASLDSLSKGSGLSVQQIRTALTKLERTGEVTNVSTNQFRVITICNYESYQDGKQENNKRSNKRATNEQQTSNKRATTSKEYKNIRIDSTNVESTSLAEKSLPNARARKIFEGYFKSLFNDEYYWQRKDAGAMKQLLQKIAYSRKSRNLPTDDDSLCDALTLLLESIKSDWILQNFSVTIINSKYNEIVSQAKGQKHGSNNRNDQRNLEQAQRQSEVVDLLSRLRSEDATGKG